MGSDTVMAARWDEPLETALDVLAEGMVTLGQLQAATLARRQARPKIGQLALKQKKLTVAQVFRILEQQAVTGELFGEIAIQMGFLREQELYELLRQQASLTPPLSAVLMRQGVLTREQAEDLTVNVQQRLQGHARSAMLQQPVA